MFKEKNKNKKELVEYTLNAKQFTYSCSKKQVLFALKIREKTTFEIVRAGLHCSLRISRQMLPLLFILGWKTFVLKATCKNIQIQYGVDLVCQESTLAKRDLV